MQKPLAEILRPQSFNDYYGQEALIGEKGIITQALENNNLHSMIFWGTPGVGKTTLAMLIAQKANAPFFVLSAINAGVKDIRQVIDASAKTGERAVLFIDEIHRFSKSQQDSLLNAVETGTVVLIGATTENPSFEVISPLLSRCQVYTLNPLAKKDLEKIIEKGVQYLEKEHRCKIEVLENDTLLGISGGDARKLLNALELVVGNTVAENGKVQLNNEIVQKSIQKNLARYDKNGENHYDIISAFIKSIRGSDPNAAVYWLARMLVGGEDPLFIARRLIILAAEDIGNANPNALLLANNCFQAVHQIGMPEARIILSQTTTYLAASQKSNAAYMAIDDAIAWVKKTGDLPVPLHIRNAPTKLMKDLNYGKDYKYAHSYEQNFVEQEFLPESISGMKFYEPQQNPRENELRKYLKACWKEKYRYVILLLVGLLSFFKVEAQDMHYSQVFATPLQINPAHAGAFDGVVRAGLNQKTQWLSVTKPFVGVSGSVDLPLIKSNRTKQMMGMGITVNNERAGDSEYNFFNASVALSYVKNIGRRGKNKIGFGVSGAFSQHSLNYAKLYFDEQYDDGIFQPFLSSGELFENNRVAYFDATAGLFFGYTPSRKQNYTVGLSVSHLTTPQLTFDNWNYNHPIKVTPYALAEIALPQELTLSPMIYSAIQGKNLEIIFGSNIVYTIRKNAYTPIITFGGGLFYRVKDAVIANFIVEFENIRINCSYDMNLSQFIPATNARGGLELSVYYIFKRKSIRSIGREPCPFEVM